ncbi:MAG: hypothetical protein ABH804_01240 [archaeon]
MELKITKEKENPLFNRKEIIAEIYSETAPSRESVINLLAEKFSVNPEVIKIKKILGKFGSKTFELSANIYSSKEEKDSIELKKKKEAELEKKSTEESTEPSSEQEQSEEQIKEEKEI